LVEIVVAISVTPLWPGSGDHLYSAV